MNISHRRSPPLRRAWGEAALLAVALLSTQPACGPQCSVIQGEHDAFRAESVAKRSTGRGAHIRIGIPMHVITHPLDAAVARMKTASMDMPGLGDLAKYVPASKIGFKARKIQLTLDRDDAAKVAIDFDVTQGRKTLFGLSLSARAPITYTPSTGKMRFSIRADLFDKVQPRFDTDAVERLTDHLFDQLPSLARAFVPRGEVSRLAKRAVDLLAGSAYDLLRREVLSDMGELTSFSVNMPDVPISSMSLTSIGGLDGFVRLDTRLDLPVEHGLPDDDAELDAAMAALAHGQGTAGDLSETFEVSVSTEAVIALANWGFAKGKLPKTYDDKGLATQDGAFEVGAGWHSGDRPLKVNLWSMKTEGACLSMQAGALPSVDWKAGKLEVGVTQAMIEQFNGPLLLRALVEVTNITHGVFDFTKTISTKTELAVGGDTWKVALANAHLDGEVFRIRLKATSPNGKG